MLSPGVRGLAAAPAVPCRGCGVPAETLLDLGVQPVVGAPIPAGRAALGEPHAPLRLLGCPDCRLVQLAPARLRLAPAPGPDAAFAAALPARLGIPPGTAALVAGGGEGAGEGAAAAALAAAGLAVEVPRGGFGAVRARRLRAAGCEPALILAGPAFARAADPHDGAAGFRLLLAPGGVLALDLPWLGALAEGARLDRLRHDVPAWYGLAAAEALFAEHGLAPFDAAVAGTRLRLLLRHAEDAALRPTPALLALRAADPAPCGLGAALAEAADGLAAFLRAARVAGRRVAALGAGPGAATLLAAAGVRPGLLAYAADADPRRQGRLLPGTRIPVRSPAALLADAPEDALLLDPASPWDLDRLRARGIRPRGVLPRLHDL